MKLTTDSIETGQQELAQIVSRAQAGDRDALETLVERTQKLARKAAFPLLAAHLVDDAVQEAFLIVVQKLHHLRDPSAFPAWLCRIVLNVCHALRKKNPEHLELEESIGTDPTQKVDNRLFLRAALGKLSKDGRDILILREFLQLDYEEISYALNLPVGTVRSRLHYSRKKLAKFQTQQ